MKITKQRFKGRDFEILKDFDAVTAIIINEFSEILLVKQYRPAIMRETLELPAGSMDKNGEEALACLFRELKEETGIELLDSRVNYIFSYKPMMGFSNSMMRVYLIRVNKAEVPTGNINDTDVFETLWLSLEELGKRIFSDEIQDVKAILAYFYLQQLSL